MRAMLAALLGGLILGVHAAALAQPKPAAKADAAKAAAPKAPSAEEKAMERAVSNYNRNKGMGGASMGMDKAAAKKK